MVIDYSIVICTYNSDERLLRRCLSAVCDLNKDGLGVEILLIDNNSIVPLSTVPYIIECIEKTDAIKIIVEPKQGHTFARMAGISAAKGDHIVFFDDDNEPESNYLQELASLHRKAPHIAVWGPGNISVDFIDGIDLNIKNYAAGIFQERRELYMNYANLRTWLDCYPYGTGMCVKRPFLVEYVKLVNERRFTSTGRKGKKLSSGDDVQIVLHCISRGMGAGVAPELKINHIIPGNRANGTYIKRLIYGACVEGSINILEVLPEYRIFLSSIQVKPFKFSRRVIKGYLKLLFQKNPEKAFEFIKYTAFNYGVYLALEKPVPFVVPWVIKKLKLDS